MLSVLQVLMYKKVQGNLSAWQRFSVPKGYYFDSFTVPSCRLFPCSGILACIYKIYKPFIQ